MITDSKYSHIFFNCTEIVHSGKADTERVDGLRRAEGEDERQIKEMER